MDDALFYLVVFFILLFIGVFVYYAMIVPGQRLMDDAAHRAEQRSIWDGERRIEIEKCRLLWGDEICDHLINRWVGLGMTEEMLRLSWGSPTYIDSKEFSSKGSACRWVYGIPRRGAKYVWFKNGKVQKIKT